MEKPKVSGLDQRIALLYGVIQACRPQAPPSLGLCHICKVKATAMFWFSRKVQGGECRHCTSAVLRSLYMSRPLTFHWQNSVLCLNLPVRRAGKHCSLLAGLVSKGDS